MGVGADDVDREGTGHGDGVRALTGSVVVGRRRLRVLGVGRLGRLARPTGTRIVGAAYLVVGLAVDILARVVVAVVLAAGGAGVGARVVVVRARGVERHVAGGRDVARDRGADVGMDDRQSERQADDDRAGHGVGLGAGGSVRGLRGAQRHLAR